MKGYQRNFDCPCGSGTKWKRCHPEMVGKFVDEDKKVIKDRKPHVPMKIGHLSLEEKKARLGI